MAKKHGDSRERPRKFYKLAAVDGLGITLDGRTLKTPGGAVLTLPTAEAAAMVAEEWSAQVDFIDFSTMPATRHSYTAIDRIGGARVEVAKEVARYAGSDLLCYLATEPTALMERQTKAWGEILDWALADMDLEFIRTHGISYTVQPAATLARIEVMALDMDDFRLSAVAFAGALFGSTILALAVERGRLTGEAAYELSRLDEAYQEEQWGIDEEAAERTAGLRAEAALLERWIRAL
jgi:chaperone required for assembly of F1-ATPase